MSEEARRVGEELQRLLWARGLSILTGITLCIHSIGFLYYGQRIINAANEAKQYAAPQGSQIASVASTHSQMGVASGVQARSELVRSPSTVSKPPRSVSATVRWLSYVVAVGVLNPNFVFLLQQEYYGIVLASTFLISGGFGATERRGTSQSQSQDNRPSLKGDSKKRLPQDVFREDKIKASSSGDV
ncbi:hypothetical protein HDV00_006451 [Rhizophlyctis rosea]|nr:hypothetical protein HDV00_006451 [Rhizophlyctis rosea]